MYAITSPFGFHQVDIEKIAGFGQIDGFDLGQGQISSYSSCVLYIAHQKLTMHLATHSHIWKDAKYPIKGLYWIAR